MKRVFKTAVLAIAFLMLAGFILPGHSGASMVQVATDPLLGKTSLAANDYYDWGSLIFYGGPLTSPLLALNSNYTTFDLSKSATSPFQIAPNAGNPFFGLHDNLLGSTDEITFHFTAPIYGFGTQIFGPVGGPPALQTDRITFWNGGNLVGGFSLTYDPSLPNSVAEFLGARGNVAFDTVTISADSGANHDSSFWMNRAQILTQPNGAVPIPGAIWLLGSGLAGLVGLRRKLSRK